MYKTCIQCGAMHYRPDNEYPYVQNTGNLLIGYGVNSIAPTNKYFNMWTNLGEDTVSYIRNNYDCILLGAANFINPAWNFDIVTANLKKLNMPIVVFGLGAQAPDSNVENLVLTESNINFANTLSYYCKSIGVRGAYTAEILNSIGVKNTTIIGCPSYYLCNNANFRIEKKVVDNILDLNVAVNYTNLTKPFEQSILKLAHKYNTDIIGQMEYVEDIWSKNIDPKSCHKDLYTSSIFKESLFKKVLNTDIDSIKSFLKDHFYQFYNPAKWITHMKSYDFVFGSRIHGAISAVQAGVPALLVVHDSRTKELADFLNIPYITPKDITDPLYLSHLYDRTDYSQFNAKYHEKFINFQQFLKINNLL